MSYYDFNEPMSKKERIEYVEENEKFSITTKHQRVPFSCEVISKIRREPRQSSVSPLLKAFLDGSIKNENDKTHDRAGGLSERARNARIEVLRKLGIER